jgi:phosphoribosylformimino-5-aminoimidazole carboxamide ribotide isomerase
VFEVIPAIDVSNGRLARLTARGAVPVESFGGDPLAAAAAFVAAGVPRLHVVDLDLAAGGQHRNLDVIRDVASLGTPVQASGAAATADEVELLLGAGAARAVLGSAALADRVLVAELAQRLGERLAIGIETDGPRVRARGRRTVDLPLAETLGWLAGTAAQRFVVTALPQVGLLSGPDLDRIRAVAALGRRTVAAGGVATHADIEAVRASGAEGVVIGRAVLDGSIDLAAALAAASGAAEGSGGAGG